MLAAPRLVTRAPVLLCSAFLSSKWTSEELLSATWVWESGGRYSDHVRLQRLITAAGQSDRVTTRGMDFADALAKSTTARRVSRVSLTDHPRTRVPGDREVTVRLLHVSPTTIYLAAGVDSVCLYAFMGDGESALTTLACVVEIPDSLPGPVTLAWPNGCTVGWEVEP